MTKIVLTSLANLTNQTTAINTINANNAAIQAAWDNNLSRDGTTPNQMGANLDMNSNKIVNLPLPTTSSEPVRLQDVPSINPSVGLTPASVSSTGAVKAYSGNAPPASGTGAIGLTVSSTTNLGWFVGTGPPTFSAAKGSLYSNTTAGSTTTRLYVNTDGATTWTNFTSAA